MQIDHVCLNVPNYEETLQWYQEKLDATIEHEWTVGVFPDLKLAYLSVYGFRIEIIGLLSHNQECRSRLILVRIKDNRHRTFCFRVRDVDAVLAELNRRGVKTFVELGSYPDPGIRLCIIQDNNGNLIEFVTPL